MIHHLHLLFILSFFSPVFYVNGALEGSKFTEISIISVNLDVMIVEESFFNKADPFPVLKYFNPLLRNVVKWSDTL